MLEAQCESWGGPVSASIYLPLEYFDRSNSQHVMEAIRELDQLHRRIEESGMSGQRSSRCSYIPTHDFMKWRVSERGYGRAGGRIFLDPCVATSLLHELQSSRGPE